MGMGYDPYAYGYHPHWGHHHWGHHHWGHHHWGHHCCGYGYYGGYGYPRRGGTGFALIVVLFILLIIVGASGLVY